MRTDRVRSPQSRSLIAWTTLRRACSFSSGATASSRSNMMMSAVRLAAFSTNFRLEPGTASCERLRRGRAVRTGVKLTASSV